MEKGSFCFQKEVYFLYMEKWYIYSFCNKMSTVKAYWKTKPVNKMRNCSEESCVFWKK